MYRQKMYSTDATQIPTNALSWDDFKAFHDAHVSQGMRGGRKWRRMMDREGADFKMLEVIISINKYTFNFKLIDAYVV